MTDEKADPRCPGCNVPIISGMNHSDGCPNSDVPIIPPPPTVRRFPVAVYFIAYVAEIGKGRKFGNQIIKSPKQLSTTQEMRTIETIISNALPATHGIVGNKPVVTIQCITNLGTMLVEETTTEEGAKAEETGDGPTDSTIADQPS